MNEIEKLEQGIAALESQRRLLSSAVVDALLEPLREKLASLHASTVAYTVDQRKQITVLFADVPHFTSISKKNGCRRSAQHDEFVLGAYPPFGNTAEAKLLIKFES